MNQEILGAIISEFLKVNNKLSHVQKKPVYLSNGINISTAALHLLEAIHANENANVTMLAKVLGVTKGSISQQIKKLEETHLINKAYRHNNRKEIFFEITSSGLNTLEIHDELHLSLYNQIMDNLSDFSDEQGKTIVEILDIVADNIAKYQDQVGGK